MSAPVPLVPSAVALERLATKYGWAAVQSVTRVGQASYVYVRCLRGGEIAWASWRRAYPTSAWRFAGGGVARGSGRRLTLSGVKAAIVHE